MFQATKWECTSCACGATRGDVSSRRWMQCRSTWWTSSTARCSTITQSMWLSSLISTITGGLPWLQQVFLITLLFCLNVSCERTVLKVIVDISLSQCVFFSQPHWPLKLDKKLKKIPLERSKQSSQLILSYFWDSLLTFFYFSTSYPDAEKADGDADAPSDVLLEDNWQLVLPSGSSKMTNSGLFVDIL